MAEKITVGVDKETAQKIDDMDNVSGAVERAVVRFVAGSDIEEYREIVDDLSDIEEKIEEVEEQMEQTDDVDETYVLKQEKQALMGDGAELRLRLQQIIETDEERQSREEQIAEEAEQAHDFY